MTGTRKRQAYMRGGRPFRYEVKVTAEQESRLRALAGAAGVTMQRLLVDSALAAAPGSVDFSRRELIAELMALRGWLESADDTIVRALAAPGGRLDRALDQLAEP